MRSLYVCRIPVRIVDLSEGIRKYDDRDEDGKSRRD